MPACVAGANATPVEVRRSGLRSMRRMLPRMQLAGRASAIMHPLVRVLDGPAEELRREARPKTPQMRMYMYT